MTVLGFTAVTPGWTSADLAVGQVVQDGRNPVLTGLALLLNLGFGTEAGVIISLCLGLFALVARTPEAMRALVVVLAGWGAGAVFKVLVHRPRPPVADSMLGLMGDTSFPSGHVCLTAAVAVAAWVLVRRGWMIAVGAVLVAGQMLARVYLGVHYPTDVLASLLVVAATSILVLRRRSTSSRGRRAGPRAR